MKKLALAAAVAISMCVGSLPVVALASAPEEELDAITEETTTEFDVETDPVALDTQSNSSFAFGDLVKDIAGLIRIEIPAKTQYTGKQIKPSINVINSITGEKLVEGVDYVVNYGSNTNVGTGTITIIGTGNYGGKVAAEFQITKANNKITNVTKKKVIKYKKLEKKTRSFKISAKAQGNAKMTFKKVSVTKSAKKYITVSKSGKVKVKKGLNKGTYKLKVKITAGATTNFNKATTTKTIKIVVK